MESTIGLRPGPSITAGMAEKVGSHDWAATPLGGIDGWPPWLRTVVSLVMDSAVPTAVWIGPRLLSVHNDAYLPLLGDKDNALGRPFREVWPETMATLDPLLQRCLKGEALRFEASRFLLNRGGGAPEEAFFDFAFSPVRDESGVVAGIITHAFEVTDRVQSARRQSFQFKLGEALPASDDPAGVAVQLLGRHLGASRCAFAHVEGGQAIVAGCWTDGGLPPIQGSFPLDQLGCGHADLRRGRVLHGDTEAALIVPVLRHGQLVATLHLYHATPRRWGESEIALVRDASNRINASAARARSESLLRESEARWRSIFENLQEGFASCEIIRDEQGRPVDFRYRCVNRAWQALTGLDAETILHHPAREVVPGLEPWWPDICARVVETGEPAHFECRMDTVGRWFDVYLYRTGAETFAALFLNITDRKQMEAAHRDTASRLREALDVETVGVIYWDPDILITDANRAFLSMTGFTREEAIGLSWKTLTPQEFHPASLRALRDLRETGHTLPFEKQYRRKDGSLWWGLFAPRQLSDGAFVEYVIDITRRKESEQRQAVMVAELQHRTRNLLAVVQSLSRQTMTECADMDSFAAEFSTRLSALGRVQGLLSRADREPITIGALLRLELATPGMAQIDERITLEGPEVRLRNTIVQTLALALHELASNARKAGALACGGGRLSVHWDTRRENGLNRLLLRWQETGASGDTPGAYARRLIEQALPHALGARTCFNPSAHGLECLVDLPLTSPATGGSVA